MDFSYLIELSSLHFVLTSFFLNLVAGVVGPGDYREYSLKACIERQTAVDRVGEESVEMSNYSTN
jgi:hypothetical protein